MHKPDLPRSTRQAFGQLLTLASVLACVAIAFSPIAVRAQCVSITSYGGSGNGTTNNSPALTSAFAALPAGGGCISFPAGSFMFSSPVTLSYPAGGGVFSLTLAGSGQDSTTLSWAASNGIIINTTASRQTVHVRDMTFGTSSAGGYTALQINNSLPMGIVTASDISHVYFRGNDGGQETEYWGIGIDDVGLPDMYFDTDTFVGPSGIPGGGIAISLNGNSNVSPNWAVIFDISKCGFFQVNIGLQIGNYIQGVAVTQSNFTGGTNGIVAEPLTANGGLSELAITGGNQFNTFGDQISIQQPMQNVILNGNLLFIRPGYSGVAFVASGTSFQNSFVNNVFQGLPGGGTGIYVGAHDTASVVTGNVFDSLDQGMNLQYASGWNVLGNNYTSVTLNVANPGSNSVGVATP